MSFKQALSAVSVAVWVVLPGLAFAHPGHDESGLMAGLAHPLTGLDHLLAMFAVGLWAAQQQGSTRWLLPVAFVGCMLLGGLLGFDGLAVPYLEGTIAASVLAFGLLVAMAARPPRAIALAMTALFALAHGVAHGLELPGMASPWQYAAGFVAATAILHACGYALVRCLPQAAGFLVRILGWGAAAAGAGLLLAG